MRNNIHSCKIKGRKKLHIYKPAGSGDTIVLMSSDASFREAAEQYLLIATFEWAWRIIKGNVASTGALAGGITFGLTISVDFKEEIEKHLEILHNDVVFLAYDCLTEVEIDKDAQGKRTQIVTEDEVPKYIINARTGKAVSLTIE